MPDNGVFETPSLVILIVNAPDKENFGIKNCTTPILLLASSDEFNCASNSSLTILGRIDAGIVILLDAEFNDQYLTHVTAFAFATPAVVVGKTVRDIGVLPVSVNLGNLPRQPFTNLWVSPFVSKTRVGVTLTATF